MSRYQYWSFLTPSTARRLPSGAQAGAVEMARIDELRRRSSPVAASASQTSSAR